jgi:hypothetical protein
MTTSRQTEDLNHPAIRELVNSANALPLSDRVTLLKALIPEVAREMSPREFEATMVDLRLKGERFYDALTHPGQGRDSRASWASATWSDVRPRSCHRRRQSESGSEDGPSDRIAADRGAYELAHEAFHGVARLRMMHGCRRERAAVTSDDEVRPFFAHIGQTTELVQ